MGFSGGVSCKRIWQALKYLMMFAWGNIICSGVGGFFN